MSFEPSNVGYSLESLNKFQIYYETQRVRKYDLEEKSQPCSDEKYFQIFLNYEYSVPLKPTDITFTDSNTIHINHTTGLDTNAGTLAAPVKTFKKARDLALASLKRYLLIITPSTIDYFAEAAYYPLYLTLYKDSALYNFTYQNLGRMTALTDTYDNTTTIFVDPNYVGVESGTIAQPYNTMQEALDNLGAKSFIMVYNTVNADNGKFNTQTFNEKVLINNKSGKKILSGFNPLNSVFTASTPIIKFNPNQIGISFYAPTPRTINSRGMSVDIKLTGAGNITSVYCVLLDLQKLSYVIYPTSATAVNVGAAADEMIDLEFFNGYLYVSAYQGGTKNIYRSNALDTWSASLYSPTDKLVLKSFKGALYGIDSDKIITTTNGTVYTTVLSTSDLRPNKYNHIVEYNNLLYWFSILGNTFYSFSGTVTQVIVTPTNWNTITGYVILNNKFYIFVRELDTINYESIYLYQANEFILVYRQSYTSTNFDWLKCSKETKGRVFITGKNAISAFDGNSVIKIDGLTFTSEDMSLVEHANTLICSKTTDLYRVLINTVTILGDTNTIDIQGFKLDGNNRLATNGIGISHIKDKWNTCNLLFDEIKDNFYAGVDNVQKETDINNMHIYNSKYGVIENDIYTSKSTSDRIFISAVVLHDIDEIAIYSIAIESLLKIQLTTIDNCKKGVYVTNVMNSNYFIINSIFSRVGRIVESLVTALTISYSVIPPKADYVNLTLGTNVYNANAIFKDISNVNFTLQSTKEKARNNVNYFVNSAGVEGGNTLISSWKGLNSNGIAYGGLYNDMGAYILGRNLFSDSFELSGILNPLPDSMSIEYILSNKSTFSSRTGSIFKNFLKTKRKITFEYTEQNAMSIKVFQKLQNILEQKEIVRIYFNKGLIDQILTFANLASWQASQLFQDILAKKLGFTSEGTNLYLYETEIWYGSQNNNLNNQWIPNIFRGLWFAIIDNTDSDPSGLYSPTIQYVKCLENTHNKIIFDTSGLGTLTSATNDLMFVVCYIETKSDIENNLQLSQKIVNSFNLGDSFPVVIPSLTFIEV